ncbi:MAG: hypothetical protein ABR884_00050 [Minisyncoccia bacterium]
MDELDKGVNRIANAVAGKNIRDLFDPDSPRHCKNCKQTADSDHVFCMWCGQHNPNFDRESFRDTYGTTNIADVRLEKCGEYHAEAIAYFGEEYKMFPDDETGPYVHPRYCTLCGRDLMPKDFVATA